MGFCFHSTDGYVLRMSWGWIFMQSWNHGIEFNIHHRISWNPEKCNFGESTLHDFFIVFYCGFVCESCITKRMDSNRFNSFNLQPLFQRKKHWYFTGIFSLPNVNIVGTAVLLNTCIQNPLFVVIYLLLHLAHGNYTDKEPNLGKLYRPHLDLTIDDG